MGVCSINYILGYFQVQTMVQNIHNRELKKNMSEMYFNRKCTMNPKCYHHALRGGYKIRPADKIESNEYIISRYQGVSTTTVWITYVT